MSIVQTTRLQAVRLSGGGWFDGDFWLSIWAQGDLDQQASTLNNYYQNLWRSASALGVSKGGTYAAQLDAHMAQYVQWLQEFHDAQLRRALPFASSRDWTQELRDFKQKFEDDYNALLKIGGAAAASELQKRATDPSTIQIPISTSEQIAKATASAAQSGASLFGQIARSQWFWPSVLGLGIVASLTLLLRETRSVR